MKNLKKISALVVVCLIILSIITFSGSAVPGGDGSDTGTTGSSEFGDWEKFYSINKTVMQRHAHPRKLIKLPIFRQSEGYNSGVACVQSVLRYANYYFDIREDNLSGALGSDPEEGTKWYSIVNYLNSVRLNDEDTQWFRAEKREHMTVGDLMREIDEGHPVICHIQAWDWDENGEYSMNHDYSNEWECGHWVVAVGYSKASSNESENHANMLSDCIFFMDPSTSGNYTYITRDNLVQRWHGYTTDENNQRADMIQMGIVVDFCSGNQPDGEKYQDAFYGLM